MKPFSSIIFKVITLVFLLFPSPLFSQDSISYQVEGFGSIATQSNTPFWIVSNTYGKVPLEANNAYLESKLFWDHRFNENFKLNTGVDLGVTTSHSSTFFIQQLYAEASFQRLYLTIGSKERYNSMLNLRLSSGDFNYSTNARPIPEINMSIPEFTTVPYTKRILQFRGDFAVGKSIDNNYILDTKAPGQNYNLDVLWHHKSLFFSIKDPSNRFPLGLTFGFEHAAQWGGWTSFYGMGELPHSFSDFMRIVMGEGGGSDSSGGDQQNVLGNHQGTYNLKLSYDAKSFVVSAYKQHYFDDNSGAEYANWRDGIWGLECTLNQLNWLKSIVFEFINTTDQSGPMHFINYDRPARGGGNDDYYNHDYYITGWSYWGRSLGNPLITSPEYNGDGTLYFKNNRIKALHLGFEGNVNTNLSYRFLATGVHSWGRMAYPFLNEKNGFSTMIECNYIYPKWSGWKFGIQLAVDGGEQYGDNFGAALRVSKSGIIK